MSSQLTPLLVAALLLNNFIIAQHVGLRPARTLAHALGIGIATALALTGTAILDGLLTPRLLLPLAIDYLRGIIAVLCAGVFAQLAATILRSRYDRLFAGDDNFVPVIACNTALLQIALIQRDFDFVRQLGTAIGAGLSAALLLLVFQALRERAANSARMPTALQGAPADLICAGLLIAALGGLTGPG